MIARLLFAEQKAQKVDVVAFFIRRIFRLYPVLLIFVALAAIVNYLENGTVPWDEIASALFYFTNYLIVGKEIGGDAWQIEAFRPLWSLAVEEHFYIVFPFIFVFLSKPIRIFVAAISVVVGCTLARYFVAMNNPDLIGLHYFGMLTQFRIDAIAFGVGLAAFCELPSARRMIVAVGHPFGVALSLSLLVVGFVLPFDPEAKVAMRWLLMGLPVAAMIAVVIFTDRYMFIQVTLNSGVMTLIGKLSYSLYIWHMLVGHLVEQHLSGLAAGVTSTVVSFVVALISYRYIEAPMIRRGRSISDRRRYPAQ